MRGEEKGHAVKAVSCMNSSVPIQTIRIIISLCPDASRGGYEQPSAVRIVVASAIKASA